MAVAELLAQRVGNMLAVAFEEPAHRSGVDRVHIEIDHATGQALRKRPQDEPPGAVSFWYGLNSFE